MHISIGSLDLQPENVQCDTEATMTHLEPAAVPQAAAESEPAVLPSDDVPAASIRSVELNTAEGSCKRPAV
eukprot:3932320-Rhodomonas_salina.1